MLSCKQRRNLAQKLASREMRPYIFEIFRLMNARIVGNGVKSVGWKSSGSMK